MLAKESLPLWEDSDYKCGARNGAFSISVLSSEVQFATAFPFWHYSFENTVW
jgi:hypothetical protein